MTTNNDFKLGVEIDRIEAKAVSKFDAFGAAEELTGLSYQDEMTGLLGLALHTFKVQAEKDAWKKVGDTYFSMPWTEFLFTVIDGYGFEVISLERITYTPDYGERKETHLWELIAAHREKKLLLYANSYTFSDGKETISGGHVYGQVRARGDHRDLWDALNGCSFGPFKGDSTHFDVDVRTGLITQLMGLEAAGELIDWEGDEWLWFLSSAEEQELESNESEGRDRRKEKETAVFSSAPEWVRQFAGRS